ncbi:MAG: PP0621 family protein [Usitatibacteraceae bacterium]
MGKIIFLFIIAAVVWVLFKGLGKKSANGDSKAPEKRATIGEKMVKCHRCGVLMPESESMMLDGNISCHDPAHCLHRA